MVYLEAEKINDEIILVNKNETETLNQRIFSNITDETFRWENRTSFDRGKTRIINGEVYAKRKS